LATASIALSIKPRRKRHGQDEFVGQLPGRVGNDVNCLATQHLGANCL
jgi:hypothetical protein